jgi:NAD(P)-dependent dehydrogenase (short-subunit alcohol dehydrogenase family)
MLVKSKLACQPRFEFRDHRVIVTGGSRGIGRAIADAASSGLIRPARLFCGAVCNARLS